MFDGSINFLPTPSLKRKKVLLLPNMSKFKKFLKARKYTVIIVGILLIGIIAFASASNKNGKKKELATAKRGTVTQIINATGKTKPATDVSLAFEKNGKVTEVGAHIGSKVVAGQLIAAQDASDLRAQLQEAIANMEAEQAQLDELKRGTRPEEIQIAQAELDQAKAELTNTYNGIADTLQDVYVKADDAIRKQTDAMFTNDESANTKLTFTPKDSQVKNDAEWQRYVSSQELNKWKNELNAITPSTGNAALEDALIQAKIHLTVVRNFLNVLFQAVNNNIDLPESTASTYLAAVNTARTNVNTAFTDITTDEQNLSSKKLAVKRASGALALKNAGARPEQISAATAAVKQAASRVASTQANINKTVLRSPITGTVTKQDAKVGEIASAGVSLVNIITDGQLEIEANIPEVDIAKVAIGNPVDITLDGLQDENFKGKISYIEPAETIVDGIVNFKIKAIFDSTDPRFKSGLTANLVIEIKRLNNVLTIPEYAIVRKEGKEYVQIPDGEEKDKFREVEIETGLHGKDAMVEVKSGLTEGDQVILQ